jgi:hypothetical protein
MTINFETLKVSLVLYGLNAACATVLLVVGWYLSDLAERFVSRLLTVTHRIDGIVTLFAASFARTRSLPWSGSRCCSGISLEYVWGFSDQRHDGGSHAAAGWRDKVRPRPNSDPRLGTPSGGCMRTLCAIRIAVCGPTT